MFNLPVDTTIVLLTIFAIIVVNVISIVLQIKKEDEKEAK